MATATHQNVEMAVARSHASAQWLIEQYLDVLLMHSPPKWKMSLSRFGECWGQPVARSTWINVPLHGSDGTTARVAHARAFAEVVGRLSFASVLQWVDFYDAFWKPALLVPIGCAERSEEHRAIEFDCFEQLERSCAPKFMLDLTGDSVVSTIDCIEQLDAFFFGSADDVIDEPHRSVLSRFVDSSSSSRGFTTGHNRPAPRIEVGVWLSVSRASVSMLQSLLRVLKAVGDYEKRSSLHFDVSTIVVPGAVMADPLKIHALADIVACEKLAVCHLYVEPHYFASKCVPLEAFQLFVHRALAVKSLGSAAPRLETLWFERPAFTHEHVASICSALRSSRYLKATNIAVLAATESNVPVLWAWIAFGILDTDSNARLERFGIGEIAVRDADVHVVHSILQSSTPGKDLWELEHGALPTSDRGFEQVCVPAGMRVFVRVGVAIAIRARPVPHSELLVPTVLATNEFEAVILLAAWTCIVVPGYGLGWIRRDSVVSQQLRPSRRSACTSDTWNVGALTRVKELDRPATNPGLQMTGIIQLLQLIGRGLEGLNLPCHGVTDDDLRDILMSCPNLTRLNISGNNVTDLSALADRYRANECKIASLGFRSSRTGAHTAFQLVDLLAQPVSKPLCYVSIEWPHDADQFAVFASKLRASSRALRVLNLYAPRFRGSESDAAIASLRLAVESVCEVRASRAMTAAFLSVVYHEGDTPSRSVKHLDSWIVALIFSFAATAVPRTFVWNRIY